MNPTHLRLRNVRRFTDLDIDLPTGTVALIGGNGAGKSSLLNAIDIALFADRGELTDLITSGEDVLEIELTFEHADQLYRVRRQLKRGKSPSVDFEVHGSHAELYDDEDGTKRVRLTDDGEWRPLTRENANATGALICETLGLSRKTFRASSFLKQGDTAAFTEADPASRKALLAEILRLDVWDDSDGRKPATAASVLGLARADLRVAEQKLPTIATRIEQIGQHLVTRDAHERTLHAYRTQLQTASDELVIAEDRFEKAQQAKASNEAAAERLRACQAELDAATADHRRAEAELAGAAAAETRRAELQEELNAAAARAGEVGKLEEQLEQHRAVAIKTAERNQALREIEQRATARGRLVDEALRLHDLARALRAKADSTLAGVEHSESCDRCGQTLGAEAAARAAASFRAEADETDAKAATIDAGAESDLEAIAALHEQLETIEIPEAPGDSGLIREQLQQARAAGERRAQVAEQLRQAAELAARKTKLEQRRHDLYLVQAQKQTYLDEAKAAVSDETKLAGDVTIARTAVDGARRAETEAREHIARTEQTLEQLTAAAAERDALIGERTMVQGLVEQLTRAVTAYGRNGIPALIVEAVAVPQIEQEANRLLELMPTSDGTTLQVQLRTQRELKGTDELRDALDIVIFDGDAERLYDSYSGGEQGRVNLCLRIALARLLAHRRGAESRLLAIDELPFLDATAQDQLVDVVNAAAGDFDRTIVVGHSETFQQSFDQTIRIVKRGGRSVVDAELQAVAA